MAGCLSLALVACGDDGSPSGGNAGGGSGPGAGGTGAQGGGGAAQGGGGAAQGGGGAAQGGGGAAQGGGGSGGGVPCEPACTGSFICCDGACVNPGNNTNHCGECDNPCAGGYPFCDNGTCGPAPCNGTVCIGTQNCCGDNCCDIGMLCCVVPGPVGGAPECAAPNAEGTCDAGCPDCVCASPDTMIATPDGERAIVDLRVGDLVYSLDRGELVAVPIARTNRVRVSDHRVVQLTLENGRKIEMSPLHPTADGRTFGGLGAGDWLHGARIRAVRSIPYVHEHTYDILPASDSGAYLAAGAWVGSTLGGDPSVVPPP